MLAEEPRRQEKLNEKFIKEEDLKDEEDSLHLGFPGYREYLDNDGIHEHYSMSIFRFKLSQEVMIELERFAKVHQHDDLDNFKEAWFQWTEQHIDLVNEETQRLRNLGYLGDIEEKMFKSARYYFRNKTVDKKKPTQRRCYTSCPKRLFFLMETHIRDGLTVGNFKPSDGFDHFCELYTKLIDEEIARLDIPMDFFKQKIKKTYKNRYFRVMTNNS